VKFLIVGIDYFTKWIKAKPLATITTQQVQQFVWKDIICHYGVSHTFITDNDRQFIDKELAKFYTGLGIKHITSSVEHSQTNGQAEAANKVILVELRKWFGGAKGRCPEDLLEVLWAYRCTPQFATNEFSFSLVYGAEAMIPVEIGEPSLRHQVCDPNQNQQNLCTHLDLLTELRDKAQICNMAVKQRTTRKYNSNLCPRTFVKGDLVWRMASSARKKDDKFSGIWDGPYQIQDDARVGAYKLEQLSGE